MPKVSLIACVRPNTQKEFSHFACMRTDAQKELNHFVFTRPNAPKELSHFASSSDSGHAGAMPLVEKINPRTYSFVKPVGTVGHNICITLYTSINIPTLLTNLQVHIFSDLWILRQLYIYMMDLAKSPPPFFGQEEQVISYSLVAMAKVIVSWIEPKGLKTDTFGQTFIISFFSLQLERKVRLERREKDLVESKKKTTALGKLFRNMGLRKSGRNKFSYKQHQVVVIVVLVVVVVVVHSCDLQQQQQQLQLQQQHQQQQVQHRQYTEKQQKLLHYYRHYINIINMYNSYNYNGSYAQLQQQNNNTHTITTTTIILLPALYYLHCHTTLAPTRLPLPYYSTSTTTAIITTTTTTTITTNIIIVTTTASDPNAYEITMNDDDRIALMVMVKEGKITTEHALEVVKRFEDHRRLTGEGDEQINDQIYGSRESPLLTQASVQTRGRRQHRPEITKPTKSSSDLYSAVWQKETDRISTRLIKNKSWGRFARLKAELQHGRSQMTETSSSPRCEICRSQSQDVDDRMRWPDNRGSSDYQCTEHRRVHSIGHMEFHQSQSPEFMRSISCSPTRGGSSHTDSTKSTSVGGSPSHSRLYSPVLYLTGGNKASDEQLLISLSPAAEGKDDDALKKNSSGVSKSASGTSLDSDLSAGCTSHGPLPNEIAATRNGDIANCSNSTMSASSETSPAGGRKPESLPARMRNFALYNIVSKLEIYTARGYSRRHLPKVPRSGTEPGTMWLRSNSYSTGDDGMSSDYDDHDETNMRLSQSCPRGMITQRSLSVNDRNKDLRNDLKKKLLRSKEPNYRSRQMNQDVSDVHAVTGSPEIFNRCKYQVTISQNSIASTVDGMPLYSGPFLGQARVHTDYDPEPQEKDALVLRKGDIIQVMSMIQPGIWKGMLRQKVGNFRFSHVEMISDDTPRGQRKERIHRRRNSQRSKPRNVEELMQRIGLEHLTSIFLLNGYDKLETFVDIDEDDLSELNIRDTEQRAKLLTAAELLVDCNSPDILDVPAKCDSNTPADTPSSLSPPTLFNTEPPPPMPIQPMSRDSGFYASSDNSLHKGQQSARPSDEDIHKKKMLGQSATDNSISEADVTNKDESQPQKSIACQTAGQTEPSTNYEISDLELSAEDREVCEITDGFAQKEIRASPKKATPLTRVQRCSSAQQSAQESIANGYISHSSSFCNMTAECSHVSPMLHHLSKKHEQHGPINVAIVDCKTPIRSCGSEGSDGTQSDLSDISPHRNSKPVSLRKSASKLCSAKTNGSLVMMDRVVSPSYHIILSDSLSSSPMVKRDVSTQMDPFRKKGNSVNENHLRTQKLIYGSKPPMFLEGDNIPNQIYFPGTLGRTIEGSYYGSKDSPNRTIPRPPKPPSRSLIPLVKAKLSDEKIDLSLEPYSDKNGYCGIPPLLVQRYAEELRHDVWGIAAVMEQVRISQLQSYGREGMTSESLAKACLSSCDLKISSLRDFLISIGLPMYGEHLIKMGFSSMERLLSMTDNDVQRVVHDTRHIKRLMHALEWVRSRLASPTRKTKIASVKDQV
uniref:SH3 domain-containing protein n=1 Tax=Octopus bimaculoides TaxID=37653 RepID=A0A0L8FSD0_OCTBM